MSEDPVEWITSLALSAMFPRPLPLTRADADRLMEVAAELRRLRAVEAEAREKTR